MKPEDDDGSADQGEGDTDGPVGSCVNNCGGFSPDGDGFCACGPQCEFNGDCCADYQAACSGGCLYNSDCAADEVCSTSTLDCVDAYWHEYDVYVDWEDHTPDCWDTFADDCFADPLYTATYGGVEVYTSGYYTNVTSAYFAEPFTIVANPFDGLTVAFYDWDDITANDFMSSVCFSDGFSCAPIGVEYLHGGGATWDTTEDPDPQNRFYVHLIFVPR
ncbi:MAG: hypothetical protein HC927_09295 [Deltaproteobacteria bacterium]|nr:hypothetical protein [Deltaproteobacteria bacterium]